MLEIQGNAIALYGEDWYRFSFRQVEDKPPFITFAGKIKGKGILPRICNAVYTGSPVVYLEEYICDGDIDLWFDKNQSRLLNFHESSTNLYDKFDDTAQAISVVSDEIDSFVEDHFLFRQLQPPMVAVAKLYVSLGHVNFILWHCEEKKSRLVVVKDSLIIELMDFWAGYEDLEEQQEAILNELSQRLSAYIHSSFFAVALNEEKDFPYDLYGVLDIKPAPHINSIPPLFHELYACSLFERKVLSFAPLSHQELVAQIEKSGNIVKKGISLSFKCLLGLTIILILWFTGIYFWGKEQDKKRIPNLPHLEALHKEEERSLSLLKEYHQYQKYSLWESAVTCFLNEFSTLIPKGAHARALEITEVQKDSWIVTLEIETKSTGHIPTIIANLEKVDAVSKVRMLYSERSRKDKQSTVKAQIEATLSHQTEELTNAE